MMKEVIIVGAIVVGIFIYAYLNEYRISYKTKVTIKDGIRVEDRSFYIGPRKLEDK